MIELTAARVRALRQASLLLAQPEWFGPGSREVSTIVEWFGAMQAQDFASAKWSFGLRMPGASESDVEAAIQRGAAIRTWPMRGTIHFVPARDARWMVELMGVRALAGAAARRATLGLTRAQVDLAAEVLGQELAGRRLTRSACVALLGEAGLATAGQHAYHLLWYVSQLGITCIGPNEGREVTFALLDEWAPNPHTPDREEALATMALRYYRSHGPTTVTDFAGWMGMSLADARLGIRAAGGALTQLTGDGHHMYATPELLDSADPQRPAGSASRAVLALPGFDEFLLGFKDRALMLAPEHKQAIIPGGNGVFQPTLVRSGRVLGTWRRTIGSRAVQLRPRLFAAHPTAAARAGTERALGRYADYLGRRADIRWDEPT